MFKQKIINADTEVVDPKKTYKTLTTAEKNELKQTHEGLKQAYVKAMKYILKNYRPVQRRRPNKMNWKSLWSTTNQSFATTSPKNISGGSTTGSIRFWDPYCDKMPP